jgi:hypothetical protein
MIDKSTLTMNYPSDTKDKALEYQPGECHITWGILPSKRIFCQQCCVASRIGLYRAPLNAKTKTSRKTLGLTETELSRLLLDLQLDP